KNHEAAGKETRVRELKSGKLDGHVADEQEVNVDVAWPFGYVAHSAHFALDIQKRRENRERIGITRLKFKNLVQKIRLPQVVNGGGLIDSALVCGAKALLQLRGG